MRHPDVQLLYMIYRKKDKLFVFVSHVSATCNSLEGRWTSSTLLFAGSVSREAFAWLGPASDSQPLLANLFYLPVLIKPVLIHVCATMFALQGSLSIPHPTCAFHSAKRQQLRSVRFRPLFFAQKYINAHGLQWEISGAARSFGTVLLGAGAAALLYVGAPPPIAHAAGARLPPISESPERCLIEALDKFAGDSDSPRQLHWRFLKGSTLPPKHPNRSKY